MLSKGAKYALKTLIYLHKNEVNGPISAKEIAANEKIPFKFLEKILRELRQHRILKSKRGAEGGYSFFKLPETIRVVDIMRIIDGPVALLPCVSENFYEKCDECFDEDSCHLHRLFSELRDHMLPILEKTIVDLTNDKISLK